MTTTNEGIHPMNSDPASWSHLPEPLRALLRELRARSAARASAAVEEWRTAFLARRWGVAAREKGKG